MFLFFLTFEGYAGLGSLSAVLTFLITLPFVTFTFSGLTFSYSIFGIDFSVFGFFYFDFETGSGSGIANFDRSIVNFALAFAFFLLSSFS